MYVGAWTPAGVLFTQVGEMAGHAGIFGGTHCTGDGTLAFNTAALGLPPCGSGLSDRINAQAIAVFSAATVTLDNLTHVSELAGHTHILRRLAGMSRGRGTLARCVPLSQPVGHGVDKLPTAGG